MSQRKDELLKPPVVSRGWGREGRRPGLPRAHAACLTGLTLARPHMTMEMSFLLWLRVQNNAVVALLKDKKPALGQQDPGTPRAHHRSKSGLPPPPPIRHSSDTTGGPMIPAKAKGTGFPAPPDDFLPPPPPPPPLEDQELPPPPPDFNDVLPDFVPPPPPSFVGDAGSLPLPPLPPPTLAPESQRPPPIATKRPPIPPKRQENPGPPSGGLGRGGEQDFMSDLMKALQKKRGNLP